jgi:polyribonucleotide nucleotidyltransferase
MEQNLRSHNFAGLLMYSGHTMVFCMCIINTVDKAVHAAFDLGKDGSTSAISSSSNSSSAGQSTQEQQQRYESVDVSVALKKLWSARLRKMVLETGTRSDGRKTDEVTTNTNILRIV